MSTSTRLIHGPLTTLFVPPEGCADVAIQYWGPTVSIEDSGPSFKTPTGTGGTRHHHTRPIQTVLLRVHRSNQQLSTVYQSLEHRPVLPWVSLSKRMDWCRDVLPQQLPPQVSWGGLDYVGPIDIGGCSQTSAVGIFTGTICHGNMDVEYTKTVITIDGGNPTAKAVLSWGNVTYTVTQSAVTENVVGLALLHREQGLSLFSAFTDKTADGSSSVPSLSPPGPGSESPADNSTGTLSTGSRVGIGVGVALRVVILAVTFWLFFRRMRLKKLATARRLAERESTGYEGKPELDANANVAGTVRRKDAMPELGIESAVGRGTGPGELEGTNQTAGVAELGSDSRNSSGAHYHELHQDADQEAGIAGTTPELYGSGRALVPVELHGQAQGSTHSQPNQEDQGPKIAASPPKPHIKQKVITQLLNLFLFGTVPIRDHSGPSTHVAHGDRAERLLTLQQEQERLNVEADRIRHLMAVEAQQRRIQDEIQRLGSLNRPGG
ncbi:hypothetical protein V8F33_010684 [Rhypophila sp. PSN 637]